MKKSYKYAIELNRTIDSYTGEVSFDELINKVHKENFHYKTTEEISKELSDYIQKISFSLLFAVQRYGKVRDYHMFYIPAFMEDTEDSELILIAKIDNNGTVLVFCDNKDIVPLKLINNVFLL